MSDPDGGPAPVSREEIAYVARKLEEWAGSLPANEQALIQLMVGNARLVEPDDVFKAQAQLGVEKAALAAFEDIASRWGKVGAYWMKVGPIWQKANPAGTPGEEVEFPVRFQSLEG